MSGRFQTIYADPAWSYRDATPRGGAANHYKTMSVDDICRLQMGRLAAPDCALFMWATWPCLPDALRVIDAWGFTFKTCAFAWVKTTKSGAPKMGMGHYSRANTEPCLLAIRGKPKRVDAGVHQVYLDESFTEETWLAQIGRHSEKPAVVRDRIVQLMGDVPRIELFARERFPGWHAWGNELPPLTQGAA